MRRKQLSQSSWRYSSSATSPSSSATPSLRSAATLGWSGSVANTRLHPANDPPNLEDQATSAASPPSTQTAFDWSAHGTASNPPTAHLLRDDAQIETYVKAHLSPDASTAAFARLPRSSSVADLYRYLVLLRTAAVYTDLDTILPQARLEWDWDRRQQRDPNVPVDHGRPRPPTPDHWSPSSSGSSGRLRKKSDDELRSVDMVVHLTGPHPWTNAIRDYIASIGDDPPRAQKLHAPAPCRSGGRARPWDDVVLPGHSRSKGFDHPDACVEHIVTGDKEAGWKMVEKEGAAGKREGDCGKMRLAKSLAKTKRNEGGVMQEGARR
ncbi:hypothetical protein DFJ73DRAFT_949431 [Zopfochytrium polystomum]|nr:hypothetical protein DFJ73DRAFT_949431 [Zopfochytrium polystomum]